MAFYSGLSGALYSKVDMLEGSATIALLLRYMVLADYEEVQALPLLAIFTLEDLSSETLEALS